MKNGQRPEGDSADTRQDDLGRVVEPKRSERKKNGEDKNRDTIKLA